MKKIILSALAFSFSAINANACIGGATNITAEQIKSVVEKVRGDYSLSDVPAIVGIQVLGEKVVVTLESRSGVTTHIYKTKPADDAGLGDKCDKKSAVRIK